MSERTVDQWVRWYFDVKDNHGPPGMDLIEQTGYYWSETCYECGARREKAMRDREDGLKYCGRCGKDTTWAYELGYTLKGQIQRGGPRQHVAEQRLSSQVSIGYAIDQLFADSHLHWKVKTYICKVMSGLSHVDLGVEMASQFDAYPFGTSRDSIGIYVREGRAAMERRLSKLGVACR